MVLSEKISCVCITHARVGMLKRAIQCFVNQDHKDKELLILYVASDKETSSFALEHPEYSRHRLIEEVIPESLVVELLENTDQSTQQAILKTGVQEYLTLDPFGNLAFQKTTNSSVIFTIDKGSHDRDSYVFRTDHGKWLSRTSSGKIVLSDEVKEQEFFSMMELPDNSFLLKEYHENSIHNISLESIGWKEEVLHEGNSSISFIELHPLREISLGSKRNLAKQVASGNYIAVWDDDDWYSPQRLSQQLNFLLFHRKVACSLANTIMYDHHTHLAYITPVRFCGWEPTLLCLKEEMGNYANLNRGEDTPILLKLHEERKLAIMEASFMYIYNVHTQNTCAVEHFMSIINHLNTQKIADVEVETIQRQLGILHPIY